MSRKDDKIIQSINSMHDLEMYEEMLELKVQGQSQLLESKASDFFKKSSGMLAGGLGGWIVSEFFSSSEKAQGNSKDDSRKSDILNQIDHYLSLFQRWSPILRTIINQQDLSKSFRDKETTETARETQSV